MTQAMYAHVNKWITLKKEVFPIIVGWIFSNLEKNIQKTG
jgi:hypothetical protein